MLSLSANLEDLVEIINIVYDQIDGKILQKIDLKNLPVFTDNTPQDLEHIYSYDNNRMLLFEETTNVWFLQQRCKICKEALFNCDCKKEKNMKEAETVIKIKKRKPKKRVVIMLPRVHCYHCGHDWHPRFRVIQRCAKCKTTYWQYTKEEVFDKRRKMAIDMKNKENYDHIKFLD